MAQPEKTLTIRKDQLPVVMKSGIVYWISNATHERLQNQLANQQAHTFVRIAELSITINTAETEGAYGLDQYEALEKTKQGMWQCRYRKWHERKNLCACARDIARKHESDRRQEGMAKKPRSVEEDKSIKNALSDIRKDLEKKGILKTEHA